MPGKTLTRIVFDRGDIPEPEASNLALSPSESLATLRAALGLPPNALLCWIVIDSFEGWQDYGYPNWQDYIYELVGVPAMAAPTTPPEAPRITWRDALSPDPVPIIALRRRAYCKGIPLYVEVRWHPTTGEAISLHGLEKDSREKSVNRARRGITLLKVIEASGGRPPDMDEEAFRQYYWDAYQKVLASGRRPTKTEVAAELLMPTKSLKRNRDRYHLPWPPLPPH